jgi:hypothetical protein
MVTRHDEKQTVFGALPPNPELKRLEPLVGTWKTEEHTRDSVLGPGVPVTSVERFSWLEGGYFLVHTYETVFGDEPAQKGSTTGCTTPLPAGSGSSSSATTARTPTRQPVRGEGGRRQADHGGPGALPVRAGRERQDQDEPRRHDLRGLVASGRERPMEAVDEQHLQQGRREFVIGRGMERNIAVAEVTHRPTWKSQVEIIRIGAWAD